MFSFICCFLSSFSLQGNVIKQNFPLDRIYHTLSKVTFNGKVNCIKNEPFLPNKSTLADLDTPATPPPKKKTFSELFGMHTM